MIAVKYRLDTGTIALVATTDSAEAAAAYADEAHGVLLTEGMPSADDCYVKDGAITPYPDRPSTDHFWNGSVWVLDEAKLERRLRAQRDRLLAESDWTDTASAQGRLGSPLYYRWQDYRQALRDVTKQSGFPLDVVWPTPP